MLYHGNKAINETLFLLSEPVHSEDALALKRRIPIHVHQNNPVCSDQIQPKSTHLVRHQEDGCVLVFGVVEGVAQLLTILGRHHSVHSVIVDALLPVSVIAGAVHFKEVLDGVHFNYTV